MAKAQDASSIFADVCLPLLEAAGIDELARCLRQGLARLGVDVACVAWKVAAQPAFEPPEAASAMRLAVLTAPATQGDDASRELFLFAAGSGAQLLDAKSFDAMAARLVELARQRLDDLESTAQLRAAVDDLERAEQLQRALFTIAELAAATEDMETLLRGLHAVIKELMYAENFFIALHDASRQTLRFIYLADEKDGVLHAPDEEIPADDLGNSITLGLIRHGRAVKGSSAKVGRALGIPPEAMPGTPALDLIGVPMRRNGEVAGAIVVQSYREGIGYTDTDHAVLGFVAGHVLNAIERKRGRDALELRVVERTRELEAANHQLQIEIAERERNARLQATLYRIAELASAQDDDEAFYHAIHQAVAGLLEAENFYIALVSADGTTLEFAYARDTAGQHFDARPLGRGISEYVMRVQRPALIDPGVLADLVAAGEVDASDHGTEPIGWLGVPLIGSAGVMGVVAVQNYRPELRYDNDDIDLLTFVSSQIASSLERRQQAEALRRLNADLELRVHERTRELRQQIAVREQVQAQLKHQVMHDPLTGLPNRLYLRERLEHALADMQRGGSRHFALLYLDVDRFKLFNDSFGHMVGDTVLREVSRRLLECVREPDVVARLSGDEFAILLDHCHDAATACRVAERIQTRLAAPIVTGERELHTSLSIGIAVSSARHRSVDRIFHDADTALYRAKAAGRNRYILYDQSFETSTTNVLDLEQQLRNALTWNQLQPHFQPIVRLEDGATTGYEALIRWQHPTRGLLGPGEFLPVAEETGLIEAVDWHMYRIACQAGAALVEDGGYITINISAQHFQNENFAERLLQLVADVGFDATKLRIEVTEGTLLGDPEAVARILLKLADAGIGAALDDFGTGYSSLGYVHRFPLRMIKIDRSFVRHLGEANARRSSAIITAVLSLARALELDVVAEGVENDEQRQVLIEMGCCHAQGFHFGRPAPASHWIASPPALA